MYSVDFFFVCFLGLNIISGFELPNFENLGHHGIKRTAAKTPLTFFPPTLGTRILNYTGNSVEAIPNSKTTEYMTGGIIGDAKYRIARSYFFWEHAKNGTSLVVRIYFYNMKFANFQNALKHPDGILVIFAPIETSGWTYNPLFDVFQEIFEKHIKKPGDCALINSFHTYNWYDHFSHNTVYISYKGSFHDSDIGEKLCNVLIIQLPKLEGKNFISCKQFADTFGSLKDCNKQHVKNPLSSVDHDPLSVVESKSIRVILTPCRK